MTDMRTPLGRVRGLGSAKEGTGHFWRIRVTAIALIPLSLFAVGWTLSLAGGDYASTRASLSQPAVALMLALFAVVAADHMRLGMQIIIEDYIHGELLKISLLMLNTFFCFLAGAVSVLSLARLVFGV